MNWTGAARTIVVCVILIALHYTLRPLLAWCMASFSGSSPTRSL